jgi:flagellar protein FliJ
MPRFVFKLESVLRQRLRIERQRQRDLALAMEQMRQLEQELRSLNNSMQATAEQLRRGHLIGRLDMGLLAAHRRYAAAMQRKGQALVQRLAAMQPQLAAKRAEVIEAAKRRKAIELLKQRRFEQWQAEESRREQAALDEVSNQMFFADQLQADRMQDDDAQNAAEHQNAI